MFFRRRRMTMNRFAIFVPLLALFVIVAMPKASPVTIAPLARDIVNIQSPSAGAGTIGWIGLFAGQSHTAYTVPVNRTFIITDIVLESLSTSCPLEIHSNPSGGFKLDDRLLEEDPTAGTRASYHAADGCGLTFGGGENVDFFAVSSATSFTYQITGYLQ
jgi:hypothetical protein